jgi:hypothetical protein
MFVVIPPHKIRNFVYLCDSHFHVESIEDLYREADHSYGVAMVFGEDAEFYTFDDKCRYKYLGKVHHSIGNNHHRGGQSQNRLARLRTEQVHRFLSKVEESIKKYYTKEGVTTINHLVISGSGMKKEHVKDRLEWLKCSISVYTELDFSGICQKFGEIIGLDQKEIEMKEIDKIQEYLRVNPDLLVFGEANIRQSSERLQKLWCKDKRKWELCKAEVIQLNGVFLDQFGGCLGLSWFSESTEGHEEPDEGPDEGPDEDACEVACEVACEDW